MAPIEDRSGSTAKEPGVEDDTEPAEGTRSARLEARTSDPARIGRFTVLRPIGQGGMGRVYAAFDESLDRRVAIKVLRPFRSKLDEGVRARVVREAKAMAKLSHPNVVQVFEVGEHEGELFVAMEFVRGITLEAWQSVPGRRWTDVLRAYAQAGEGLVAAHAAGLVHRDFKPQNVMVEDDGAHMRVRVLDFGLARRRGVDEEHDDAPARVLATLDDRLTATGSVLGTPAYMAPEQFSTAEVDHAADQFSFCVSLWEGLYGERPFGAVTGSALVDAAMHGRLREPPRDASVPSWVRTAIVRGLAVSPIERWPSMRALLDALGRDPAQRRTAWIRRVATVGLLGVGTAGAIAVVRADAERCTGAAQQLAGIWDDARRTEVESAILDTDLAYAADAWRSSAAVLDAYAQAWTDMHTDACTAATVRGEQSVEVMDLRMACLHRARTGLQAVTKVLADPDPNVVQNAHEIVAELAPLSRCADVDALRADAEPPSDEDANAVATARSLLADARAQIRAGRHRIAEARIEEAARVVATVEYAPVEFELALAQGSALGQEGRSAEAEAALTRALQLGIERFHRDSIQVAASKLLHLLGKEPTRTAEAMQRYRMLAEVLATGDPTREAAVHNGLGHLLYTEGKFAESEVEFRAALALREQLADLSPTAVASAVNEVGNVLLALGRYKDAEAEFRRAAEVFERELGPSHPSSAMAHANMSSALWLQGRYEEAEAAARTALTIYESAYGAESLQVANSLGSLAATLFERGAHAEAEVLVRRALAIETKVLGPTHVIVARSHNNLGLLLDEQGRHAEAEAEHRRALELKEAALGPEHPEVGTSRLNLAMLLWSRERTADAEAEQRAALLLLEKALGPTHPDVDRARVNLAGMLEDLGRHREALDHVEEVWPRRQGDDVPAGTRASTAFLFARLLVALDAASRERALELARLAVDLYTAEGDSEDERVERVRAWLREHE